MIFPHHRYIDFLLLAVNVTSDEMRRVLQMDRLRVPDVSDLARIHVELAARPASFNPFDADDATQTWLRKRGISGLVRGDRAATEALAILRSAAWRQTVEVLLLAGIAPSGIINFLRNRAIAAPSAEAITAFASYFWATAEMSLAACQEFLRVHPDGPMLMEVLTGGADLGMELAGKVLSRLETHHVLRESTSPRTFETARDASGPGQRAEEPMPPLPDEAEKDPPAPAAKPSPQRRAARPQTEAAFEVPGLEITEITASPTKLREW